MAVRSECKGEAQVSNQSARSMEMPRRVNGQNSTSTSSRPQLSSSMPLLFSPSSKSRRSDAGSVLELTLEAPQTNNEMRTTASTMKKSRSVRLDTTQPEGPEPVTRQFSVLVPRNTEATSKQEERSKSTGPLSLSPKQPTPAEPTLAEPTPAEPATATTSTKPKEQGVLRSLRKPMVLKAVVDSPVKMKIRPVQALEDLKSPLSTAKDGDLVPSTNGKASGPTAPSPDDIFANPFPLKFNEAEATEAEANVAERIQETVEPAQLDVFDLGETQDSGTAANDSTATPDSSNAFDIFTSDDSAEETSSETATTTLQDGENEEDDIRSAIQKQLEKMEKLPPVPGTDEAENLPSPNDGDNPLDIDVFGTDDGDDSDADKERAKRELADTNGVDCASGACADDMAQLRRRERTDMSLNITPTIEPTEEDMAKVDEIRIEKLAKARPRTWTDRAGNVIADGKLEDYRHERVYVKTMNGTIRQISHHKLSDADRCFVSGWWELPLECHFEDEQYKMRDFRMTTFTWVAAATCHKPLFFEQPAVERYGHSAGPIAQPIISGAHFFGDIVMLPYHAGITPPNECVYSLGHYRPGDCAPWLLPGFPFSTRAFKWEGMALGAAIALLP